MNHHRSPGLLLLSLAMVLFLICAAVAAEDVTAVVTGRVVNIKGQPVEGVRIYVYRSPEVRKAADFISNRTDRDGRYRLVVMPGHLWGIARQKKTDAFGPLLPGEKHSGDPAEIDVLAAGTAIQDFVIADIRDAKRKREQQREGLVRISGTIVDELGMPMKQAYVVANRGNAAAVIPDYLSPWVDKDGRFTLYVPTGTYSLGAACSFPPDQSTVMQGAIVIDAERSNMTIVVRSVDTNGRKQTAP